MSSQKTSRRMSRRDLLRASSLLTLGGIAAGILAACQPEVVEVERIVKEEVIVEGTPQIVEKVITVQPAPLETVQIRLAEGSWVGPEGIRFWTDEIIPRFELENPDIKVMYETAESPDYADKLYTQAVAGDAPDVMFLWGSINYNMMLMNQLLLLDEHFAGDDLSVFYSALLDAHYLDGKLYGLPKYTSTICLAYNKDLLDEAGVAYPDGTWNWDDYLAACRACTKRDASGDITQWGTYVAHDFLHHWVWMNGGEWMNALLFGDRCLLDEPKALEALQFKYDMMYGADPVSPRPGFIAEFGWWNVFSTGRVALMESHSWTVTNYMRENDFGWEFTDLPVARDGTPAGLTFANGYCAYKGTHAPEASLRLLRFLTEPWAAKQMCVGILGLQPARRDVVEQWDNYSLGAQAGYDVAAFSRVMDHARLEPYFKDGDKVSAELFTPIWEQIWVTGDLGLEEGVNLLTQRINEYLQ